MSPDDAMRKTRIENQERMTNQPEPDSAEATTWQSLGGKGIINSEGERRLWAIECMDDLNADHLAAAWAVKARDALRDLIELEEADDNIAPSRIRTIMTNAYEALSTYPTEQDAERGGQTDE